MRCSEFTIKGSAPNFNSFTITGKSGLRAATCNALLCRIEQETFSFKKICNNIIYILLHMILCFCWSCFTEKEMFYYLLFLTYMCKLPLAFNANIHTSYLTEETYVWARSMLCAFTHTPQCCTSTSKQAEKPYENFMKCIIFKIYPSPWWQLHIANHNHEHVSDYHPNRTSLLHKPHTSLSKNHPLQIRSTFSN